jgi:hypothetical protein
MSHPLFTDTDLAEMRAHNVASLPDRCVILEEVIIDAPGGRETSSWVPVFANVPCRLSTSGAAAETMTAEQLQSIGRWVLVLPVGTAIHEKHHVTVTLRDGSTRDLNVISVGGPKTYEIERKVMCSDLTAGGR